MYHSLNRTLRAHDDNHALAEIMVLVGTDAVTAAASQYGKKFITSERCPGVDLGELCKVRSDGKCFL